MSSVTGEQVQLSIFGESHGPAIGCVIDGLPAGIPVDLDAIYKDMARRAPGRDKTATPRLEKGYSSYSLRCAEWAHHRCASGHGDCQ